MPSIKAEIPLTERVERLERLLEQLIELTSPNDWVTRAELAERLYKDHGFRATGLTQYLHRRLQEPDMQPYCHTSRVPFTYQFSGVLKVLKNEGEAFLSRQIPGSKN